MNDQQTIKNLAITALVFVFITMMLVLVANVVS